MPSLIPTNTVPPPTVATPLGYFPPPFESCLDTFAAAAAALNPRTSDRTEVEKSLNSVPHQQQVLLNCRYLNSKPMLDFDLFHL